MAENQTRRQRKLCTPAPLPEGLGADGQRTLIPLIMSEASGCEGREKHLAVSSTSLSRERWAGTGGLGGGGRKESGCKTAQPLGTLRALRETRLEPAARSHRRLAICDTSEDNL